MNVVTALIAGLLAGWLIEWIIDWILWRRREAALRVRLDRAYMKLGSADAASHALEHQLEALKNEHAALQSKYTSLAARIADTQPLSAVKKVDEEETWIETAPAAEWVPEEAEVPPAVETAANETPEGPASPEPSPIQMPGQVTTGSQPAEAVPPEAVPPVMEEQPAQAVTPEPELPVQAAPPAPDNPLPAGPAIPGLSEEPSPSDNLRAIKGIGPAIDYKLRQAGIRTYKDLAESTPERLADAIGNTFLRLVNVDALIEQARLLAAEKDGGGQG